MKFSFAMPAAVAAMILSAPFATADDVCSKPQAPPIVVPDKPLVPVAPAPVRVLVFGDGAARFNVERDATAGRMTFRLADPAVKIDRAPVVLMTTDAGPQEVVLTPVEGRPGEWYWAGDAVKTERFDGSMRVVVAGKSYTSPLTTVWTSDGQTVVVKARHGGRVLAMSDCGASVEVVQDPVTGTLTIYSFEDVVVTEAPVITITETTGPTVVTLTKVEGQNGVWVTKNESFKTTTTSARIRLLVNGKPCEAALVYGSGRGGKMVKVDGGPSWEVVRDDKAGYYTFYAVDETYDGKTYVVENPTVVVDGKTYNLTRVEGEPRAWRLVGLDAAGSDARDGQLNFTLFGKTLSTRLGLSGFGIGVK
jgi:hypothetical protein